MFQTQAERVDLQYELEDQSMQLGIKRYREKLQDGGNGAVSAGTQLIRHALRPMEEALRAWLLATGTGLAGRSAGVYHFINQLDPVVVSWLTAHTAISTLHSRPSLAHMSILVAMQMEAAVNIDEITKKQPRLAAKVAKRSAAKKRVSDRLVFIRKGAELADVRAIQWDDVVRARVGALLITMFSQSTGLVEIDTVPIGNGKTNTVVRPSESCMKWLEGSHARCELLTPERLPMLCTPRRWSSPFNGGYLTKGMRKPLVKTRSRGYLAEMKEWEMPAVYAAVNALQGTEWSVNQPIFGLINALHENNSTLGGLPEREDRPLPAKPWEEGEEPTPEALHAWKVEAARTHEFNYKLMSKRLQLVQKLWTAEMMQSRGNRFHYVYSMDWRGRMYPAGSGMNPQGDDVAKALLTFTESVPLGEEGAYWLAVHGANCYGVDKVNFDERIAWVESHQDLILRSAADPVGCTWWAAGKDGREVQDGSIGEINQGGPFQFLAFCLEWARLQAWVDAGAEPSTFTSNLPAAFDGACNGLQNFSALLRDPVGGAATGLVPGENPADIYSVVANASQTIIDTAAWQGNTTAKRWVGKMTRRLAKRNTMTVPYGVTKRGMKDQLFSDLVDSLPEHRSEDAAFLADCNYAAISTTVVAANVAMEWLKEAAKVASSNKLPVHWETPMGFLAVQDYRIDVGDTADFTVLGRRYQLLINREGDKLNTRKQALGISPNFVHSLDAAHLQRTVTYCVEDGMKDFAMIHDSYGCHAGHATLLRDNLRDAFVDQYTPNVLKKFRDELAEQLPEELREELPPLPEMGTLDLEQVRKSEYFFA